VGRLSAAFEDRAKRVFLADAPDKLWVMDISQHCTGVGWVCLAAVIDVCSRRCVGWSIADHLRTELVVDAIDMARWAKSPKTTASKRTIMLTPRADDALALQELLSRDDRAMLHAVNPPRGYVFTNALGDPFRPGYLTHEFGRIRLIVDVPKITFHGPRLGMATMLLGDGATADFVAKSLGHSSTEIVSSTYQHFNLEVARKGAERFAIFTRSSDDSYTSGDFDLDIGNDETPAPGLFDHVPGFPVSTPPGTRTRNPLIKSQLLCQLS